jgi:hypothetical protein
MDNLLFANIPHNTKDDDLRTWIESRGFKVNDLRLIRDVVSGSSPAFARVQLNATADETAVQSLNQQQLGDRRIYVRRGRSPLDD